MRTFSCVPASQSKPTGSHIYSGIIYRIHQAGEGGDLVKIKENTNKSTILQHKVSKIKTQELRNVSSLSFGSSSGNVINIYIKHFKNG